MKLRPPRLQTSGGEADATPPKNEKKTLGAMWRIMPPRVMATKIEAMSPMAMATKVEAMSPRAMTMVKSLRASTKTMNSAITANISVAPTALAAEETPREEPNPENQVRTPLGVDEGDSQKSKAQVAPKEYDPNAPLKHRLQKKTKNSISSKDQLHKEDTNAPLKHKLPKKHPKNRSQDVVSVPKQQRESKATEVKVPQASDSETTVPVHNSHVTKKVPSVKSIQVPPTDNSAPIKKQSTIAMEQATSVAGVPPRIPSTAYGSSSISKKSKTSSASSRKSTKSSPSPKLPRASSHRNPKTPTLARSSSSNNSSKIPTAAPAPKIPHTTSNSSKQERSPKNQYVVEKAVKEEEAASATSAAMAMAAAKNEARKKKSALQQFREGGAEEAARIANEIKLAEIKHRWEKNGPGGMAGLVCNTKMGQVDDPEGAIMTPRASNATPKSVKKDLLAKGEIGNEGFEVTKKTKACGTLMKSAKPATKVTLTATENNTAVSNQDSPTKTAESTEPHKPQNKKVATESLDQASVLSNKPVSAKEQKAKVTLTATESNNAVSNQDSPTTIAESAEPNRHQKNKVTTESLDQAIISSNKPVSEAKEQKACDAAHQLLLPVNKSKSSGARLKANTSSSLKSTKSEAKMSPKSKNCMRRQRLASNSLTDTDIDAFPDTGVHLSPKYSCFGSEAIIPDTTSSESLKEASNAIGKVINLDPEKAVKKMDIDRVVITENEAASPKGMFSGMSNFFRTRNQVKHHHIDKVDSIFDDIDDGNPPRSPVHRSYGFCNAMACGDLIFGADEIIVEGQDGELRLRNIASLCNSIDGEEIIEVQTITSDILDEMEEDECSVSDTDLEGDVLDFLDEREENTQYGSDIDCEEDETLKIDSYTSFGEENSASDDQELTQILSETETLQTFASNEEELTQLLSMTETEESSIESEEESSTDVDTDFDSESATTDSTVSDGSVEELSETITIDTPVPTQVVPTSSQFENFRCISPIMFAGEGKKSIASAPVTPTFESNFSFSNRKSSLKDISSLLKRTLSGASKKSVGKQATPDTPVSCVGKKSVSEDKQAIADTPVRNHSEKVINDNIDCDPNGLAQAAEGAEAIKEGVDCTQENVYMSCTKPAEKETRTTSGDAPAALLSSLPKTSPNVEVNISEEEGHEVDHESLLSCISRSMSDGRDDEEEPAANKFSDTNLAADTPTEVKESRQDASLHACTNDFLREDSSAKREDNILQTNCKEQKNQSFACNTDSLDSSSSTILSKKPGILNLTTTDGVEIPPTKGHARRKSKVGFFFAARSSKLDKGPENE